MQLVKQSRQVFLPPYQRKDRVIIGVSLLLLLILPLAVIYFSQSTNFFGSAAGSAVLEPENGTPAGNVSVVNDPNASGGKYIVFDIKFTHPGILVNKKQLDFVKAKIVAKKEPWLRAYNQLKASRLGSLSYVPQPVAYVGCGASSNPNEGCSDEMEDAEAAYGHALLYYYSGNAAHARKSIEIMNAWSSTLIDHKFDSTTYTNGHLQAAWAGSVFPRAGEIIRYTYNGWAPNDITKFESMLNTAFLPHVINGWTGAGANWQLSMAEATIAIGVFTNNNATFFNGIGDWRAQVPAAVYLSTDNPIQYPNLAGKGYPYPPPNTNYDKPTITTIKMDTYWHNPTRYISGLEQETCRDFGHMVMGLAAASNTAETARIQGIDLYNEEKDRLIAGYEYNAKMGLRALVNTLPDGTGGTVQDPDWACPTTKLTYGGTAYQNAWEIGYNHYAGRLGIAMPNTQQLVNIYRPTAALLHMNWETLSHGSTGNAGTQ